MNKHNSRRNADISGRRTHQLMPDIEQWYNIRHGHNYYMMQILSGHGCFNEYLKKYKKDDRYLLCVLSAENSEHTIFECSITFNEIENLGEILLSIRKYS